MMREARRVFALELYFAELDDGLDVGVICNVGHDFLGVRAEARLKRFDRIKLELSNGQIGSRRTWSPAANTVLHGHTF